MSSGFVWRVLTYCQSTIYKIPTAFCFAMSARAPNPLPSQPNSLQNCNYENQQVEKNSTLAKYKYNNIGTFPNFFPQILFKITFDSEGKGQGCILARLPFDQLLSLVLAKKPVVQIGLRSPKTKFQSYRPINNTSPSIFVFGSIIMGKEPLAELKFAIFKNWLDTRPKMETHEPRVYPTSWGVFRGVFGVRSKIWALKVPFFGT